MPQHNASQERCTSDRLPRTFWLELYSLDQFISVAGRLVITSMISMSWILSKLLTRPCDITHSMCSMSVTKNRRSDLFCLSFFAMAAMNVSTDDRLRA
jgi:hypothetical protein